MGGRRIRGGNPRHYFPKLGVLLKERQQAAEQQPTSKKRGCQLLSTPNQDSGHRSKILRTAEMEETDSITTTTSTMPATFPAVVTSASDINATQVGSDVCLPSAGMQLAKSSNNTVY